MPSEATPAQSPDELSPEADRRLELFAEQMFARIPADLADDFPSHRRRAIAQQAFAFFSSRADSVAVRIEISRDAPGTAAVQTLTPDQPFIVDSILEYFRKQALPVRMILHPVFNALRDDAGDLISFEQGTAAERPESYTYTWIELVPGKPGIEAIRKDLTEILTEVARATEDFDAMTAQALTICDQTSARRGLVEVRDFLRWLVNGGFVFLGYRNYSVTNYEGRRSLGVTPASGLGILRDEARSRYAVPVPLDAMDPDMRTLLFEGSPLIIGKARAESRVHRRAPMDDITIRRSGPRGEPIAMDRFVGLFTSKAYAEEAQHIPVLRAKLAEVLEAEAAEPGSHDYKELTAAFNSFPKEELFRACVTELRAQLRLVMEVKREDDVRLSLQSDPVRGNVVAMVIMPREHFSAEVRVAIQNALAARLNGKLIYYHLAIGDAYSARLHFCYAAEPPGPAAVAAMEADTIRLARTWEEVLRERLLERFGQVEGHQLASRWLSAFNPDYKSSTVPEIALNEIVRFEDQLKAGTNFSVYIDPPPTAAGHAAPCLLKLYELGEAPILSELVPVLQNFGISVISEDAHELKPLLDGKPRAAFFQSFRVMSLTGEPLPAMLGFALLPDALVAVRTEQAEDDPLNALTLCAGLTWREVALVRTYLSAAFQMRLAPARPAVRRPLLLYPQLARILVDLFTARLDSSIAPATPSANGNGSGTSVIVLHDEAKAAELRAAYLDQCAAVDNIADDRVARTLLAMVEATVRTNYFLAPPSPYITLKFASQLIPNLPDTAPLYEIHVNSPRMEGCHLRAGRVARGGIRYSDRPDDYRTEILDLMKTQTVKNAIIVPIGSKGGFIVKGRPGRAGAPAVAVQPLVVEAYSTLIHAMLDLTDNIIDGKVVQPAGVRVLDTDGPYLVVAADKGTAAFSDIANDIAETRGFWLADAFASGGKHGYDHKKMGITARGAWESAKRHLREMGRDLARGFPITVAGIGDMSGDVFGNGMLYSENLKLLAAFDHRHIFLDPDPDPKISYAERRRLYDKPGSQWADYDSKLMSAGGGVFRRGEKRIALTPQVRAALKCDAIELDADSLVQAILRAPVDMLYNGGVGTYVRASSETDAEVGDHANDTCRIAASDLRCKMVVEGGNLGFTQKARIEYSLAGGRINTDAIDNSAGVDMSDHEVNLKILLAPAVARGALSASKRNHIIAEAAEEVGASVLRDNRDQVLSLSLEQVRSRTRIHAFRDHLTALEQQGRIRRSENILPSHEELTQRRARFAGLTRPELALVSAYTKIDLSDRLAHSELADDDYMTARFLNPYFPASIATAFAAEIPRHSLRRELVATRAVNQLVDIAGAVSIFNLTRDYDVETAQAMRGWLFASGVLRLAERAEQIRNDTSGLTDNSDIAAFLALAEAGHRGSAWAITHADPAAALGAAVDRYQPAFEQLAEHFEQFLTGGERTRFERSYREMRASVQHEQSAHQLARMAFAGHLLNVLSLSFARGREPIEVARPYFELSRRIEFATLESAIEAITTDDQWERRAANDLAVELFEARTRLCAILLEAQASGASADSSMEALIHGRERRAAEVDRLMGDLRALPVLGLPALSVAVRALARLAT
ncbi:MAG TPA: NAD-glutamate dehydrogenase domain-containing protein [Candidatus Binataceae bacterium]|nr:NAD-glutamate dehydrogenase domain-containing protein [Candidatus Binataceae bacterium]